MNAGSYYSITGNLNFRSQPVNFANLLLSYVREQGGDIESVLSVCDIDNERLDDESYLLSINEMFSLIDSVSNHLHIDELGFEIGKRQTISTWGRLGYALMACDNIREAMLLAVKYQRTTANDIRLEPKEVKGQWLVDMRPLFTELERLPFCVESTLASIQEVFSFLAGHNLYFDRIELSYPAPAYSKMYEEYFQCEIKFDCPESRYFMTLSENIKIRFADKASFNFLLEKVKERDQEVFQDDLIEKVKEAASAGSGVFNTQTEVASKLNMSTSTLSRRLKDYNVTFQKLSDDLRCEISVYKLLNTNQSNAQVALAAGYCDVANFNKAFRRWVGVSPAKFRKLNDRCPI